MASGVTGWASAGTWEGAEKRRLGLRDRLWMMLWQLLLPPEGHRTSATATGFVLILVCLGLGTSAYQAGSGGGNILFMALSLLLSSIVLSGLLSAANFNKLRWRLLLNRHATVGEPLAMSVEMQNGKRLLPTYGIAVGVSLSEVLKPVTLHQPHVVNPSQSCLFFYEYVPAQRGKLAVVVNGLQSTYPFGFLKKSLKGRVKGEVIVFPAPVSYTFTPLASGYDNRDGNTVRRPGSGDNLLNLRPYQAGDHQRMIHWKATARLQRMMVRQVMEEHRDGYTLAVDTPRALWSKPEQFEKMLSFAATLALDLFERQQLKAVRCDEAAPKPIARQGDLLAFLEWLALADLSEHLPAAATGRSVIAFRPSREEGVYAVIDGENIGFAN